MIRIGLLGASRISRGAVIEPAAEIAGVDVTHVAARDPDRAAGFADEHGIPNVLPDYDSLIECDEIDLVYNGLPPAGHAAWSIAALDAGKHVLCEKPFAMNADEAQSMVDAAERTGKLLIEAFHHRYHPAWIRTLDVLQQGEIGTVTGLSGRFNFPIAFEPGEIRYDPALGGGALMDLGCYPVHWARSVMGTEPEVVSASAIRHASGVDVAMQAELRFRGNVTAAIECSMSEDLPDELDVELEVVGESGSLIMTNPLVPHAGHKIIVQKGVNAGVQEVPGKSTYYHQLASAARAIMGETQPLTGGADAVNNMRVVDAAYSLSGLR